MQSSIECPVCSETFERDERVPLILQCGHTLCKLCCISIYRSSRAVVCPLDRKADRRVIELIPCSLHILELIEHIKTMQQTIAYLKLDPQNRADEARKQAEDNVRHAANLVEEIEAAIGEVIVQRDKVLTELQGAFSRLQLALADREQRLVDEVNALAEQNITKYRILEDKAKAELVSAQTKEADIASKAPIELTEADMNLKPSELQVPLPEFNLKFLWNEEASIAYCISVGKVGRWRVKAPYECEHFLNVTYWMRPACCQTYYCCNKCHDSNELHSWQYATRMVCMYCDNEQDYRKLPNVCEHCSISHKGVVSK